ncbi:hypothetical protein G6F35_015531 [Rhizopus arrhizus]|nr:hypothetical protein G6F35_015531 [Rhizopus arrhizus]
MPRTRSTGSRAIKAYRERSNAQYDRSATGRRRCGKRRASTQASKAASAADTTYTARQPHASATRPATVRASNRPITTPPCAAPTTWPRSAGAAKAADKASKPCVIAVPSSPSATMPASSHGVLPASATEPKASTSSPSCPIISRRRSSRSPRGTTNSKARAHPSCVAVMTMPTALSSRPNSRPMASNKGWA